MRRVRTLFFSICITVLTSDDVCSQFFIDGSFTEPGYSLLATKKNNNSGFGSEQDVSNIYKAFDGTYLYLGIEGRFQTTPNPNNPLPDGIALWLNLSSKSGKQAGSNLGVPVTTNFHYLNGNSNEVSSGPALDFKADFEVDYMFAFYSDGTPNFLYVDVVNHTPSSFFVQRIATTNNFGSLGIGPPASGAFSANSIIFASLLSFGPDSRRGIELRIPVSEFGGDANTFLQLYAGLVSSTAFFSDVSIPGNITAGNPGFSVNFGTLPGGPFHTDSLRLKDIALQPNSLGLYRRSTFTGSYTSINGTFGPFGNDYATSLILPFPFRYCGNVYTQALICTNGWIELGSQARPLSFSYSAWNADLFSSNQPNKTLAPWWDDLTTGSGSVEYDTVGSFPNRTFIVEWKNVTSYYSFGKTINFQVRMYETTNKIEFWYGPSSGTANSSESASIGLEDHVGGPGHFIEAVSGSMTKPQVSLTTTANWPTAFYRFEPTKINLLRPNGGERFFIGTTDTIRWLVDGPVNVKLEYSTDAGGSWSSITNSTPAIQQGYIWSVPNAPTGQALVRISDVDSASVFDVSDSVFQIGQPPVMAFAPDSLAFTVNEGDSADATVSIHNNGAGDLNYTIHAVYGEVGGSPLAFQQTEIGTERWKREVSAIALRQTTDKSLAAPKNVAPNPSTTDLPLVVSDPIGDGGAVDVREFRGFVSGTTAAFQLVFETPLNPNDFGGYIGLDVDRDQNTGTTMPYALVGHDIGCEFFVNLFNLSGGYFSVYDSNYAFVASVQVTLEQDRFTFSLPTSLIGEHDGLMHVAAVVGNAFGPTDWIPDLGHGVLGASWLSAIPSAGTVAPGDSVSINVRANSANLDGGEFHGRLMIFSDDPNKRWASVSVSLKVLENPNLVVRDSVSLPKVTNIGYPDTVRIEMGNNGSQDLIVLSVTTDNSDFTVLGSKIFALLPNTIRILDVQFHPTAPGVKSANLTIVSNDPDSATTVRLYAKAAYPPSMTVRPDSFEVTMSERDSVSLPMTISNSGSGPLIWNTGELAPEAATALQTSLQERQKEKDFVTDEARFGVKDASEIRGSLAKAVTAERTTVALTNANVLIWSSMYNAPYWNSLRSALESAGFIVTQSESRPIQLTSSYVAVFISEPLSPLSSAEISNMKSYVMGGGRLIDIGDSFYEYMNSFLTEFGVTKTSGYSTGPVISTHPIFQNVGTLTLDGNDWDTQLIVTTTSSAIAQCAGQIIASVTSNDRLLVFGEDSHFSDYVNSLADPDNMKLLQNVIAWIRRGASPFVELSPDSGTVAPGDSQIVTLKVNGKDLSAGDYMDEVVISSNDPVKPLKSIRVKAHLLGVPNLVVADTVRFGRTTFIGFPDTLRIPLKNDGSDHLVVLSMLIDNNEFSPVGPTPFVVASKSSRFIAVRFNPSAPGTQSALLTLKSNDPDSLSSMYVIASGAYPPEIAASPDSFSVALNVGDSATVQLTISNSGLGPLEFKISNQELISMPNGVAEAPTVSGYSRRAGVSEMPSGFPADLQVSRGEILADEIVVFNEPSTPTTSTLPVIIRDPSGDGGAADILEVRGSSGDGILRLACVFAAPVHHDSLITLFAIDIDQKATTGRRDTLFHGLGVDYFMYSIVPLFGDSVVIYDSSFALVRRASVERQSQELSLSVPLSALNGDDGRLSIVVISGMLGQFTDWAPNVGYGTLLPEAPWLSSQQDTGTVAPSGNAIVNLKIRSVGMFGGTYQAVVRVASNDPDESVLERPVALQLTGVPAISSAPDSLKFGQVYVGYTKKLDVVITNIGTDLLTGIARSLDSAFVVPDSAFSIAPSRSKAISVFFSPRQSGPTAGSLTIVSNAVATPPSIQLAGVGAIAPNIQTSLTSFPTFVMKHTDTTYSSFRIRNTGGTPLIVNISDEVFSGSSGSSAGFIYAADGSYIKKIDLASKSVVSTIPSPVLSQGPTGLAFSGTELYIEDTFSSQNLYVVDPATGAIKRSFPLPSADSITSTSNFDGLAYVNDKLYALAYSRNLIFILNPQTGAKIDSLIPPVSIGGGMDGSNGRLFVGSFDSHVYELNPTNGSVLRSFTFGETSYGIAFGNERLFLSSISGGRILEVNPQTGARIDSFYLGSFYALAGGGAVDAVWLTETPTNATVSAGDSTLVQIRVLPRVLPFGVHKANIVLASNDPDSERMKILVTVSITTAVAEEGDLPREFALNQNYPNPFNPSTTLSFDLPAESHVKLVVYNVLGQELVKLVDELRLAGRYKVLWDAGTYPSGLYLFRISAGDFVETRKMLLLK